MPNQFFKYYSYNIQSKLLSQIVVYSEVDLSQSPYFQQLGLTFFCQLFIQKLLSLQSIFPSQSNRKTSTKFFIHLGYSYQLINISQKMKIKNLLKITKKKRMKNKIKNQVKIKLIKKKLSIYLSLANIHLEVILTLQNKQLKIYQSLQNYLEQKSQYQIDLKHSNLIQETYLKKQMIIGWNQIDITQLFMIFNAQYLLNKCIKYSISQIKICIIMRFELYLSNQPVKQDSYPFIQPASQLQQQL
ncbi:hypothetical protein TTHERM_000085308 (macronuclear) [Tetrahymena thermophila SB210]|uniref:Uncharacterized protein n=1 Tax=Tetrahymena thermophila (strain SB210) TaxID=312017 RepID=W7XCN4_TETTS|nr:hypothetical protein TTHERM_000085308 [Tetrahymena thermophila SB210]EWS75237.1 hypothetical protein TTHERM_000085308 [Tetrahymena thermophila SB210]|eukprot:XP_012652228.1 hypothetical protein TTHERM_000085308 [Tetrahymena thermophila SB210]